MELMNSDKLDIATIFNIFDEIAELHDVIIAINFAHRLNDSLTRSGHIDDKFNNIFSPAEITELCISKSKKDKYCEQTIANEIIETLERMFIITNM